MSLSGSRPSAEDRRRDLLVLDLVVDRAALDVRVGDDQQNVGVIVAEAAMLGDLFRAAAVDRAMERLDDDVGRAAQGRVAQRLFQLPPA